MRRRGRTAIALMSALLGLGLGSDDAPAFDSGKLSGMLDVTAVRGDFEGQERETVRQDYRAQWSRNLFPNIQLRGGFRFYRFDLDEATSSYRRELRPDAELIWRHPAFGLTINGSRRETRTNVDPTDLVADDFGVAFRSRSTRYPAVGLRFDLNQIEDAGPDDRRDNRDRRLQASLDQTLGHQTFGYVFSYRASDNLISDLESIERSHLLRLGRSSTPITEDLRIGANYTFSYREQEDKRTVPGDVLERVSIVTGLHREDPSPEFDALAGLSGLNDGNRTLATDPAIDIGGAHVDQNIGVDLGFSRRASAIYLYTDRPSGSVAWRLLSSEDNLTWSPAGTASSEFNPALLRYELTFGDVEARYLKVVNAGLNPVAEVFVTEIEVFVALTGQAESSTLRRTHVADAFAAYQISERLGSSLAVSMQHEPAQGGVGARKNATYSFGSEFEQSEQVTHRLRWSQGFQFLEAPGEDLIDGSAGYTLTLRPLEGLTLNAGGLHRTVRTEGRRTQEDNNATLGLRALPLRGLSLYAETTRSRNHQYVAGWRTDGWAHRMSVETRPAPRINASVNAAYSTSRSLPSDTTQVRIQYGAGLDCQLSRTIFLRGSAEISDDERIDSIQQDYLLTWSLAPKVRVSGTAALTNSTNDFDTQRYGALLDYALSHRTSLYFQYTQVDFSGAGGAETQIGQVGVRTGF